MAFDPDEFVGLISFPSYIVEGRSQLPNIVQILSPSHGQPAYNKAAVRVDDDVCVGR